MKTVTNILFIVALLMTQASVQAALYKWKDARGNTQYGDTPPPNVNATPIDLPKLTVIDNYANQWKPMDFDSTQASKTPNETIEESSTGLYNKLEFLAPKANQAIRANDGDVSAMISLKPPLKKGHQIVFSIDGKTLGKGTARTSNFENLNRGSHSVGVKVIDKKGKVLKSNSVTFNVLRFSKLSKKVANNNKVAGVKPAGAFSEVSGASSK